MRHVFQEVLTMVYLLFTRLGPPVSNKYTNEFSKGFQQFLNLQVDQRESLDL